MPGSRAVFSATELLGQLLQSGISSSTRGAWITPWGLRRAATIVDKLRESGANAEALDFVRSELRKRMDLEGLIRKVPSEPLAVQLYAVSPLAFGMDTGAERQYLRRLTHGLRLEASVVLHVHQCLGEGHA